MCGIRESLRRWGIEPVSPGARGLVRLQPAAPADWVGRFCGAVLEKRSILVVPPAAVHRPALSDEVFARLCHQLPPSILIPTGGTRGHARWARHTWETLVASAEGFLEFFGEEAASAVCVLPLHHVSGLMSVVRAIVGRGQVQFGDYRELGHDQAIPAGWTVSLVPTQLGRLVEDSGARAALRCAGRIPLGGAKAPPGLLEHARMHRLPVAPCYGMTETAAMITAMQPEAFLAGETGVGRPLPHVQLEWDGVKGAEGGRRLGVRSKSLFLGYVPEEGPVQRAPWWTSDAARLDAAGNLHIIGRLDRVLISGGENVDADRIERVLGELPGVRSAAVLGVADPDWGERVVAALEADGADRSQWAALIAHRLAPAERPKELLVLPAIPRTAAGKLDRDRLLDLFGRQKEELPGIPNPD